MATKAQINANRRNSQKSTGPQTAEGKEAVSQNAFKHGLFVNKAVIRGESQDEYDLHREALLAELGPVGEMETILADRVVNLTWRLNRAERMQNQSVDYLGLEQLAGMLANDFQERFRKANGIRYGEVDIPADHLLLGRLATRDFTNYRVLEKMQLYERRIESSLHKTRAELRKLQVVRKQEQAAQAVESAARTGASEDHEPCLKKQTQLSPDMMGARTSAERIYGDKQPAGSRANKANQSQFKTPEAARPPVKGETAAAFQDSQ